MKFVITLKVMFYLRLLSKIWAHVPALVRIFKLEKPLVLQLYFFSSKNLGNGNNEIEADNPVVRKLKPHTSPFYHFSSHFAVVF